MSIESAIEEKIREAMAKGEFDNLAGAGKPLDLNAYFDTPEDLRMAFAMLKSNDFVPEEVEILKQAAELKEQIRNTTDPGTVQKLKSELNSRMLAFKLLVERRGMR